MNDIIDIVKICLIFGTGLLCIFLIISGILRWLSGNKRKERLNILSWMAFILLCVVILLGNSQAILSFLSNNDRSIGMSAALVNFIGLLIKLLILITVPTYFGLLFFEIYHFVQLRKKAKKELPSGQNSEYREKILFFLLAVGIPLVFLILPFLVGTDNNEGLIEKWKSGVEEIVEIAEADSNQEQKEYEEESNDNKLNGASSEGGFVYTSLVSYALLFIIILGIGYAATKVLYTIIANALKKTKHKDLVDEYSGAMGLLAVGVALLWSVQGADGFDPQDPDKMIGIFVQSFVVILFIIALIILTLETIRLLMDIREKLIRQEAKYLFISLIGQVSVLLNTAMHAIYEAVSSLVSVHGADMEELNDTINQEIIKNMEEQLENYDENDMTFSSFNSSVTKK